MPTPQLDDLAFLRALYDAGLAWIQFPAGRGGLGLDPALQDVVDRELEAVGRRPDWNRNPMGIGMVAPTLTAHGSDEQQEKYLRRIWTAEDLWSLLFSEPGSGSDVASLATRAVREGNAWVINGQKVWTSLAHQARWGLLIARTDPNVPKHQGLTWFVIDMRDPAVLVRPLRDMSGHAEFCEVFLSDLRVQDTDRVGNVGDGWRVALTALMHERFAIGAPGPRNGGPIGSALRMWRTRPEIRNESRRQRLVQLWSEAEVLRLTKVRAHALRGAGRPGPEGSILKLGDSLLEQRICTLAVSLLGVEGMLGAQDGAQADDSVQNLLIAQAATIGGGTSEIMRNILGERVLGLPSETRADSDVPWNQIKMNG